MFLCRCLLRWLDNSSNSVDNWIFTKRESSICSCNRCYCSGNLDCIPLCRGCFYSIIPISTAPVFWLGQLINNFCDWFTSLKECGGEHMTARADASLDWILLLFVENHPRLPVSSKSN